MKLEFSIQFRGQQIWFKKYDVKKKECRVLSQELTQKRKNQVQWEPFASTLASHVTQLS